MKTCLSRRLPGKESTLALLGEFSYQACRSLDSATTSVGRIDRTTKKKMDRDNQDASEVLFKARIDNLFLLRTNLGSVGYSNWINYVDFRMMHPRKEQRNYCGPRHDGAVIHGWTTMKLEIGSITEKIAVIVVENLIRPLLISLSTLKRTSEIRVDYQRRCIHAGDSSVPLLEEIGTPLGESRMRQIMAPSDYPRVLTGEVGEEHFAPRSELANKGRTFVWGSVCDEIVDIEIDKKTDCNLISEGLLEPLGAKTLSGDSMEKNERSRPSDTSEQELDSVALREPSC